MQISIIGTGYVGLVTGTCLADFGLRVICVDKDRTKISRLKAGQIPIYEQGLEALVKKNVLAGRLDFTTDINEAVKKSQVIFIAVGTPSNSDGSADLSQVEEVARVIARNLNEYKVIVNKCTVPVGTARKIKQIIKDILCETSSFRYHCDKTTISNHYEETSSFSHYKESISSGNDNDLSSSSHCEEPSDETNPSALSHIPFDIVSNPEFLREGTAVYDFTHPDKIVIGFESEKAKVIMQEIYRPLYLLNAPFVFTTLETAEMIKYACNAFLATKITFINEIANLCDRLGADVNEIARAMGMDGRISPKFLHPGPGFGGSCFPKDTLALNALAVDHSYDFKLVKAVIEANLRQREIVVEKIEAVLGNIQGKTLAVLGLAFKQNTDDIRESPAIDIIKILMKKGVSIRCFDPMAMDNTKKILPDLIYCADEYVTALNSDALVILTEWNQFRSLNLLKMKTLLISPILFDMRNLYDPLKVKELGIEYYGIGRN